MKEKKYMSTLPEDTRLPCYGILRRLKIRQITIASVAGAHQSRVSLTLNGHLKDQTVLDAVRLLVPRDVASDEELFGKVDSNG
jgi:hypothetical protein